ncbi:MAG: OmpA family protein [Archangium sp.]|nr:OmpA family protein [Archangium sp.]
MHRTLIAVAVLVVAPAFAQVGDEWSTFPPAQPAPAPTKPADPPPAKVEPRVAPAPAPAPVRATPPPRAAAPAPTVSAADAGVDPGDADTRIVSQKERYLAGTEPHSPSTWGNAWNAPENARVSVGQVGVGTVFVPSARLGAKGVVRVSVLGEYFNQLDFPVRSSQNIRSAVTFAASFQPFEWGEVFVSYGAAANTNNRTSPNLIQALGDLSLGIKASKQWAKGFHAGADLRLLTFSGVGNQGVDRFAVGFKPTLLATYDFRALSPSAPFIFTLGLGFTIDSTSGLVTNQRLNASEEFALNVNRYHRFNFNLALELPFPVVTPYFEYLLASPLGVPNNELTGPDGKFINASAAMAQQLGLGLKITAVKDLTFITGFNLGLSRSVGLGVPGTPPWNFYFGMAFAIDPFQRGETKFVDTVRERKLEIAKAPPPVRLEGTVTDLETKQPLPGVIVSVAGLKPSATNAEGQYESLPITGKSVKLSIARDGYKPVERDVAVDAAKPTKVDVALEPDVKKAKFEVSATANKKPVKADIVFTGPAEAKLQTPEGAAPAEIELPAGTYTITASATGHLAQTRDVQVSPGGKLIVTFELVAAPKKVLVVFKGDKIEILQQVRFATGKSTILPESFNLLQQVVDAIIKNNVRRVKVEGHTDNRGGKAQNQVLSEDRARSVMDYLAAQGIDKVRMESVGYGDSKPIAPNLTARGRELNRRVEFIVLEK